MRNGLHFYKALKVNLIMEREFFPQELTMIKYQMILRQTWPYPKV
jgi:hypothetical protein